MPARLLEVNRKVINGYLGRTGGGKVSFTHVIGYAMVQALKLMPSMNYSFTEKDGKLYGRGLARQKQGDIAAGEADVAAAKALKADIAEEFAGYGIR